MRRSKALLLSSLLFAACGDGEGGGDAGTTPADSTVRMDATAPDSGGGDAETPDVGTSTSADFPRLTCGATPSCVEVKADRPADLLDTLNDLTDGTTVILGAGTFSFDNAVTIRNANRLTLTGQGIDVTTLSFAAQTTQANGVDVIGDDFTISHLTITDSKKDGLRVEDSENVWIHHVKVTWSGGPLPSNGGYAIYPVRCTNVLLEDSEAYNASDAGLYVGQSINVIVRRNIAKENVAGLEIENTQFAEVYENLVENNAGGLLVFDLPGNPVIGRDILVRDNTILGNNQPNFAPIGTTVSQIPAGTGTFALASRRVEIRNNRYDTNKTTDIALLSGLAIRSSTMAWAIPVGDARGDLEGLNLLTDGVVYLNFRTDEIWVHDNTHVGGGTDPDDLDPNARQLGVLLSVVYFGTDVDDLLYDGIGEVVDPMTPANNTNRNHVCIGNEGDATLGVLDLPKISAMAEMGDFPGLDDIYRPAAPEYVPFDCDGLTGGPVPPVLLPFGD
jgi:parallel beta-helix repeat protein